MYIRITKIEDLQRLLYILNAVTLDLQQKGINQWDYPWDEDDIFNQIRNHYSYVLLLDEKIIGTFCINNIENINGLSVEVGSKYLSQIAILPKYQGRNFGSKITEYACSLAVFVNIVVAFYCFSFLFFNPSSDKATALRLLA
ncbi:GNAT family N-acetyltransferase [Aquibacillus sp. 3ASR75-11]|uniref:GNAT family N-acetyltransferase n=1 Tax=Terrihalobacillus insolitus TaxID=2950438 RepID=A0A9X3WTB3_9BACI|nr:GNAT family N-acetyltransferase [Terrihalobacillus insolitus]MDC3425100.1 GNAT family N-acetyltransferase [Terrihalobacillus insolitus]